MIVISLNIHRSISSHQLIAKNRFETGSRSIPSAAKMKLSDGQLGFDENRTISVGTMEPTLADFLIVSLWLRGFLSASGSEVFGFDRDSNSACFILEEVEECDQAYLVTKRDFLVRLLRRDSGTVRAQILRCLEEMRSLDLNDVICFQDSSSQATSEPLTPEASPDTTVGSTLVDLVSPGDYDPIEASSRFNFYSINTLFTG